MTAAITTSANENDEHRDYLPIRQKVFFRNVVLYFIKPSLLKMIRSSPACSRKKKQIRSKLCQNGYRVGKLNLCTDTSLS
jgi:hypothetical protein